MIARLPLCIVAGFASALVFSATLALDGQNAAPMMVGMVMLLSLFAALPLSAAGWAYGPGGTFFAATAGALSVVLAGSGVYALAFLCAVGLPSVLLITLLLAPQVSAAEFKKRQAKAAEDGKTLSLGSPELPWRPFGQALGITALVMTGICCVFAVLANMGIFGQQFLLGVAAEIGHAMAPPAMSEEDLARFIGELGRVIPAGVGGLVLLQTVLCALIAHGIMRKFSLTHRPNLRLHDLCLPPYIAATLGVGCIAAQVFSSNGELVGITVLTILVMAYLLQGLAFMHKLVNRRLPQKWRGFVLLLCYIILLPLSQVAIPVLIVAGFVGALVLHMQKKKNQGSNASRSKENE
jgi:hypothetical protein